MKWFYIIILLFLVRVAGAQSGLNGQYQFNYLALNPAIAGESGAFALKGILGNQFNGTIRPNQVAQVVAIDGQLYNQSAMSFQGFRTNVGNIISTGINLGYAKGFELGEVTLKAGINGGLFVQPNVITAAGQQRLAPFAGAGLLMKYKTAWLGLSNPMLVYSSRITETRPWFLHLGYLYDQVEGFALQANILGGFANSSIQTTDFNAKAIFFDRLALGASYRIRNNGLATTSKNVLPFAEIKVSRTIVLGLSYDSSYGRAENAAQANPNGVFHLLFRYVSNGPDEEQNFRSLF